MSYLDCDLFNTYAPLLGDMCALPAVIGEVLQAIDDKCSQLNIELAAIDAKAAQANTPSVGDVKFLFQKDPGSGWRVLDGALLDMTIYEELLEHYLTDIPIANLGVNAGAVVTADYTTDTFTSASHGFSNGDRVMFSTDGTLPAGLDGETLYYVRDALVDTFKVELTFGGGAVNISDNGTGTHKVHGEFYNLDMRGRMPLPLDDMGTAQGAANVVVDPAADTIADESGEETHTLTVDEMPAHTHTAGHIYSTGGDRKMDSYGWTITLPALTATDSTGGDGAHNNMPPYLTCNIAIYSGVTP